eukprot:COSAG01_NODE_28408_length_661_cov_5.576512_1_plen_39_part_10
MGLIYHAPKWELIGIIVLYFGGEYYSDTPFMLSPISPGS